MYALIIFVKFLIAILLTILFLFLLILFIPFGYYANGRLKEELTWKFHVSWLFGLISIEGIKLKEKPNLNIYLLKHCIYSKIIGESKSGKKKKGDQKKEEKKNKEPFKLPETKFIKECLAFLKDMLILIKPKVFLIKGCYGLEDPSITGVICMVVEMIKVSVPSCKIYLQPVFMEEVIELEAEVSGNLKVFKISYKVLRFLTKKEVRKNIFKKSKKLKQ